MKAKAKQKSIPRQQRTKKRRINCKIKTTNANINGVYSQKLGSSSLLYTHCPYWSGKKLSLKLGIGLLTVNKICQIKVA